MKFFIAAPSASLSITWHLEPRASVAKNSHFHFLGKDRGPQSTHWCFTVNNYKQYPEVLPAAPPGAQYLVFQVEKATSGTPHIQGYLQLEKKQRCTFVNSMLEDLFGAKPHTEPARGSDQENEDYCTKEETREHGPFRWGTRVPHAGKKGGRTDLLALKQGLDEGKSAKELMQAYFTPMSRLYRFANEYRRVMQSPRNFKTIVILLVGPSGTGKSRTALQLAEMLGPYYRVPEKHGSGNLWCDDYQGEPVFWIDEMDGNRMPPTFFNQLADRYPMVVPAHGGAGHQFVSKYLIICSNYHPRYWWKKRNVDQVKQITRRIDIIIKMIPPQPQYVHRGFQNFGNNINK